VNLPRTEHLPKLITQQNECDCFAGRATGKPSKNKKSDVQKDDKKIFTTPLKNMWKSTIWRNIT